MSSSSIFSRARLREVACFDFEADLRELAPGSYRLYMDIGTDAARDIFELYSYQETDLPEETAGTRTYRIIRTRGHSQYILEITDASVPLQAMGTEAPAGQEEKPETEAPAEPSAETDETQKNED